MMYHCLAIVVATRCPQCLKKLNTRCSTYPTVLSTPKKKMPKNATATITTKVVTTTSCRVGQVTWRISTRTSCKNERQRCGYSFSRSQRAPARDSEAPPAISWFFNRSAWKAISHRVSCASVPFGRGGGIRTPTSGFGDRRSTVEPTPLRFRAGQGDLFYFTSRCPVCFRHRLQNFLVSTRSECFFLFFV